jgi:hypothetical protein
MRKARPSFGPKSGEKLSLLKRHLESEKFRRRTPGREKPGDGQSDLDLAHHPLWIKLRGGVNQVIALASKRGAGQDRLVIDFRSQKDLLSKYAIGIVSG